MTVLTVRRSLVLAVSLAAVVGLGGCSGSSSSVATTSPSVPPSPSVVATVGSSSALATASPERVPQLGQILATAPLSEGSDKASECDGIDDDTRGALQRNAYERGWAVRSFTADTQGCWESAEFTAEGQTVQLAVDADQEAGVASLRVKDIVVSPSASPSEGA